jgi:hypothetical protein
MNGVQLSRKAFLFMLMLVLLRISPTALAHGGVAFSDDQCVIRIDYLTAHFTVYQPQTRDSKEYCEDLPDVTETIFVMEYLHDFLRQMPVDFRIIEDTEGFGQFAKWEDVEKIADINSRTVFYQPPGIMGDGSLTANYRFEEKGSYIGIVTAQHPDDDRVYRAVFYFQTGGPDYGTMPLFFLLLLVLQMAYWLSNGGWTKLKKTHLAKRAQLLSGEK